MSVAAPTAPPALRLDLVSSGAFAATTLLVHAAAAGVMLTVLTGWVSVALAVLLVGLGAVAAWDRALLRAGASPRFLEIRADGTAKCLFANGESADLAPPGTGVVTRYWVALGLRAARRRSLFVARDMLSPKEFRMLRLWALWGRVPGVATIAAAQVPR